MSTTDTEGLHPDDLRRRLPSITTPLTSDTERDERLREARANAGRARRHPESSLFSAERDLITLDREITRLDAVVTAVRDLHSLHKATRLPNGGYEWSCDECGADLVDKDDRCPTVRALDGGAR